MKTSELYFYEKTRSHFTPNAADPLLLNISGVNDTTLIDQSSIRSQRTMIDYQKP